MSGARIAKLGLLLCLASAMLGAFGLSGWLAGTDFLFTIAPGQPPMMPNTALAITLLGVAAALRHAPNAGRVAKILSVAATLVVLAIGLGTLAEHALAIDLRVDELVPSGRPGPYPGRPSPPTALALALLALAVLLFDMRSAARARPSEWLVLTAGFIGFVALLGVVLGADPLYRLTAHPVIGVVLPTAIGIVLVSAGMLLERPEAGVMRMATSSGPGGVLLRRLVLPTLVLPALFVGVAAHLFGAQGVPLVIATAAATMTFVGLVLLTITAAPLDRMHAALEASRTQTRVLLEQASDGIFLADLNGRYTSVNDEACRMLGYSREELLGKSIVDLIPPEDVDRLAQSKEGMLEGSVQVSEWNLRCKDGTWLAVEVSAKILPDGRWQAFVRDIRERKRTEQALRESEERLRLAAEAAGFGTFEFVYATSKKFVSPQFLTILGLAPDTEIPEDFRPEAPEWILQRIHSDDRERAQSKLEAWLEGGGDFHDEHRVLHPDGSVHWVRVDCRLFTIGEGATRQPVRLTGTLLDITARKRIEEALRASEAKFSGLIAMASDAIISIDDEQRIVIFNEGAAQLFGWKAEEIVGQPFDRLLPERFRGFHRQHVRAFALEPRDACNTGTYTTIFGLRKNGTEFAAEASISKLGMNGTMLYTVVLRDISARKSAEREQKLLADAAAVLASTLDYEDTTRNLANLVVREMADVCIVETSEEDARGLMVASRDPDRVTAANDLRRLLRDRWLPRFDATVVEAKQTLLISQVTAEYLASIATSDEQRRVLVALGPRSLMAVPLVAHGRLIGAMVLVRTTTSHRYSPEDVSMAEKIAERAALAVENAQLYRSAQRAVAARDDLLGIVAHDLRNPLGAILMQTSLLRRQAPDGQSAKRIDSIERAARRMNRLIQDLLDVTRIEAGRLPVEPSRIAVRPIVSGFVEAQKPLAAQATVELVLDVSPSVADVLADRDRLLQVFENLVGNAIKFTGPGGRITIGARRRGDHVLFWVADTGVGIAPENLQHLFDRFWQARNTERRGAGLGLPIVKGIVEAHGGDIWVESTPGRGSTMFFTIPAAPRTEQWRPELMRRE